MRQKIAEKKEQEEFSKDLDVSLSRNVKSKNVTDIRNEYLHSILKDNEFFKTRKFSMNEELDFIFNLKKLTEMDSKGETPKPNQASNHINNTIDSNNTVSDNNTALRNSHDNNTARDKIDSEIALAMGDDDYLPLGHLKFNWKQMNGYYDISKKQAKTSFRWAIIICFLGISIIVFAVLSPLFPAFTGGNSLIPVIGSIGGAVVELFAGTIFVLYIKSLSQMNLYHKALSEYQRYLSCVNLVSKVSILEKQDLLYEEIIRGEIKKGEILDDGEIKALKKILDHSKRDVPT